MDKTPVTVFIRIKSGTHCLDVIQRSKRFQLFWIGGMAMITKMEKTFYECERDFLINHPFLSCFTEIQLIKPK